MFYSYPNVVCIVNIIIIMYMISLVGEGGGGGDDMQKWGQKPLCLWYLKCA